MNPLRMRLDLGGLIVLIAVGVLAPVMLLTAVGIVALVLADDTGGIVTDILVLCFAVAAVGSTIIAVVLMGRKARLARMQSDFVAGVSHEFKTPLSAIRLYAQTLQSGANGDDPAQREQCLATILREAAWLDALVDGVLMWRGTSRGDLPLTMRASTLAEAVNSAVELFRTMVAPEGVHLQVDIKTDVAVSHDSAAITAVVMNLLTNAHKYTGPEKQISVRVRDEADVAIIEVADNGPGITPTDQKRLFEPFYRGRAPKGSHTGGAGLGLAIAHHLVSQHGGTIGVMSAPGEGARFCVRIPAREVDS